LKYWRFNLCLIGVLLTAWLVVTLLPAYFARQLNFFYVFSWPFPFWMAAFGAPLSFLSLIGLYAWLMDRRDTQWRNDAARQSSVREGED
jgi:putative solute:sodium symporter small subunit